MNQNQLLFQKINHTFLKQSSILACLGVGLLVSLLLNLQFGTVDLTLKDVWQSLLSPNESLSGKIVFHIRLPRVLLGMMIGAALASAGCILQGVMRNPLAEPGIIGVTAGGGVAVIAVLLLFPEFRQWLVPTAFVGAALAGATVYLLAWKNGTPPVRLVLSGVAIAAFLSAISSLLLLSHPDRAGSILNFLAGSLAGRGWEACSAVQFYIAAGLVLTWLLAGHMNLLILGDDQIRSLGIHLELLRGGLLAIAALLAAASVGVAGMLGFAGLIAPHLARLLLGANYRWVLPGAMLLGAILVTSCDLLGRTVLEGRELPAGIFMALLGPPFFLWLLRRSEHYEA